MDVSVAMHVHVWNVSMAAPSALGPTVLWIPVADKPLSLSAAPWTFFSLQYSTFLFSSKLFIGSI